MGIDILQITNHPRKGISEALPVGIEQDAQIPQELTLLNTVNAKVYANLLRQRPDLVLVWKASQALVYSHDL